MNLFAGRLMPLALGAALISLPAYAQTTDLNILAMNGTYLQESGLIGKFEAENPQYKVHLAEYPWQAAHGQLTASMAAGQPPDVSLSEDQWVSEFYRLGLLQPLDDFKTAQGYKDEDFMPRSWSYFVEDDGKLYAAPSYAEGRALFYRKDLFEAAGITEPPKTLEDLITVGKKLTNGNDRFALADQGGDLDLHFFSWLLYANGGDVYDEAKTTCTLTSPEAIEALTYYKSLYDENIIPKDPAKRVDTAQGFEEGYYAMAESGPWWLGLLKAEAPGITGKWATAPLPAGKNPTSYGHPNAWIIPAQAANKEGAEAFIAFMLRPENAVTWFQSWGAFPPARAAFEDPVIKGDTNVPALVQSIEQGTNSVHGVPNGQAVTLEIIKMISNVKDGIATPEDAAAESCGVIDGLLNS
jgi:ABC-type glycerol-3-phosphate transport system substrate-binding protein